ncbi:MAG: ATP-binding protein [Dissulfurimicrobium sp.]|uniref:sensor histidine kinase n=1 Tax=Dissulfurimicrobium sp. TaxID=2022436 RepID=UPI003D0E5230
MRALLVLAAALLTAVFILRYVFARPWSGFRKACAPPSDLLQALFEKGLLSREKVGDDVPGVVEALAGVVIEQDAKIKALNAIIYDINEGVLLTDGRGGISLVNNALLKMLNQSDAHPDDWIGRDIQGLVRAPQIIRALKDVDTCLEQTGNIRIVQNNKEMDVTVRRLDSSDGGGCLMIFNDVSGLVRSEQVAKDLVANVAHQLRTPLTSIKGYAETLLDQGSLDPEMSRRFLTIILKNSDRLAGIVRNILTLAQLESAGCLKGAEKLSFKEVVLKAVDAMSPFSEEKGIRLDIRVPEKDVLIVASPSAIEQAVVNLIDNAVKYSSEGSGVAVVMEVQGAEAVLSVSDEGPGIPTDALDKVFERFYRLGNDKTGGAGLGLSIVRQVAQIHNGRTWVEGRLGHGSTFYLAVPVSLPDPP